jgi:hypothetical protein
VTAPRGPNNLLLNGVGQGVYVTNGTPSKHPYNTNGISGPAGPAAQKAAPDRSFKTTPTLANTADYLKWGVDHADGRIFFNGYCEGFANVSAAIAMGKAVSPPGGAGAPASHPLPANTFVEVIGSGGSSGGHVYIVIDRPGAAPGVFNAPGAGPVIGGNIDAWGANCYVVDPWYALQASTHAAPPQMVVQASTITNVSAMGATLNSFGSRRVVATFQVGTVQGLNLSKWRA